MNARTAAVALIVTVLHAPVLRAQPSFFSETVEVRVTNVDAIVTDEHGNPVAGLTREDFEIYENGRRQEISNFAEVRETVPAGTLAAAAPQSVAADAATARDFRPRVITLFIDNATLEMGNRNAVLPQLREFLTTNVRPGDAVGIYVWANGLIAHLELTDDHKAIMNALDKLATVAARGNRGSRAEFEREIDDLIATYLPEKPFMSQAISIAAAYALRGTAETRQKSEALKSVISSLRGVEGRKVLVLLTEQLSTNPGEYTFYFLDSIHEQFAVPEVLRPQSEARHYVLHDLASDIAAAANSAGVTLYPINALGMTTDDDTVRDASQRVFMPTRTGAHTDTSTATLRALAQDTGGRAMAGSSNWKLAFDTIANDLGIYYSLGYRTSGERKDRMKKVEVRVRNKRYSVRTRKAIVEQTVATEMNDAVTSALFHSRDNNDLGIRASIGEAAPAGANLVHPLTVTIPTSTLTLIPDGTDLVGSFSIFTAFLRSDGAVSKVGKQTHQFRFPAASLSRRRQVTVKLDVTADARVGAISLGIMDEASRATGFQVIKLPTHSAGL